MLGFFEAFCCQCQEGDVSRQVLLVIEPKYVEQSTRFNSMDRLAARGTSPTALQGHRSLRAQTSADPGSFSKQSLGENTSGKRRLAV